MPDHEAEQASIQQVAEIKAARLAGQKGGGHNGSSTAQNEEVLYIYIYIYIYTQTLKTITNLLEKKNKLKN